MGIEMRVRRAIAAILMIAAAGHGRAVTIDITNGLDANDFGVTDAVISGVLERAAKLWEGWLPTGSGNKPADHPQNAEFTVLVAGSNIDAAGKNPANTVILSAARPSGNVPILIDINTVNAATGAMFWDPTPATTTPAEFSMDLAQGAGRWKAANGDLGFGKFDMLTVMLHELGHALGFSRDYSDFTDWADDIWNPDHPGNTIGTPAHFSENLYLMSAGAGFTDGKSGRSFLQPLDGYALEQAYGYMLPEPSSIPLLALALAGITVIGARRRVIRR